MLEQGRVSTLRLHHRLAPAAVGAALAVACGTLSPSGDSDPCTQLGTVCDSCKLPADQQNCQNALASADDAQCAAILDQKGFQADCVPGDAGGDADGAAVEAAALPACGAQGSPDAGCACSGGSDASGGECSPACAGGGCDFTCTSGTCTPTCAGGRCTIHCESGAVCEASCAGGDCIVDCKSGSQCANTCPGGGCTFQCEEGAVCNDTCAAAMTCVGM
jgi:hypothetical protein